MDNEVLETWLRSAEQQVVENTVYVSRSGKQYVDECDAIGSSLLYDLFERVARNTLTVKHAAEIMDAYVSGDI